MLSTGMLAIDTSSDHAGIALATENGVQSRTWLAARAQTTSVLPEISRLVREAGMQPQDVGGITVATGPGTFTGLRVGIAIAKGLVAARQMPLVGIPTLEIVFAAHPHRQIIAVLPAGRGRVVWQRQGQSPVNATLADLIETLNQHPDFMLVGELTAEQQATVDQAGHACIIEPRDPAVLLALGTARLLAGEIDDPIALEPTYLHGLTVNAPPIEDRLRPS